MATVPSSALNATQLLATRRTLSAALREWTLWSESNTLASPETIWEEYWKQLRPAWGLLTSGATPSGAATSGTTAFNTSALAVQIHPAWRNRLAIALSKAAFARFELEAFPSLEALAEEIIIWEAALAISSSSVAAWDKDAWTQPSISVYGYEDSKHRLADLYRRTERIDFRAISLYIEVFTGASPGYSDSNGPGGYNHPTHLIERGARIEKGQQLTHGQLRERYGFCLRLSLRRFPAPWVANSLSLARVRLPKTVERAQFNSLAAANQAKRDHDFRTRHLRTASVAQLCGVLNLIANRKSGLQTLDVQTEKNPTDIDVLNQGVPQHASESLVPTSYDETAADFISSVRPPDVGENASAPNVRKRGRGQKKAPLPLPPLPAFDLKRNNDELANDELNQQNPESKLLYRSGTRATESPLDIDWESIFPNLGSGASNNEKEMGDSSEEIRYGHD